ncbi:MAG: hypothetical protein Q7T13_01615 [Polaromonas sp.]|nr:hypothetical protein [Polaromonas sp.]
MNVEIVSVHNHGKAAEEFVLLKVLKDCLLGNHILTDSTYQDDTTISNRLRHMFWFPGKSPAKAGEYAVVYTRAGKDGTRVINGNVYHEFFWDLKGPIWNDTGDAAVLISIAEWAVKRTGKK